MTIENINTSKEIIDATQNAVLEVAENVSNIIEEHTGGEHEIFYQSAEFWVATAFVLTIILLSRPIYKALSSMINKNIENIQNRIHSAAQIQDDAEKLLASYERKFRNVKKEADAILKKSQNEIEYIRKATLSKLEQDMALKEKEVADKLLEAKNKASQEVANIASSLSIKAVRLALKNKLQDSDTSRLIDDSINKIEQL